MNERSSHPRVFLSFATEDKSFAFQIRNALAARGVSAWYALAVPGDDSPIDRTSEAISTSDYLVVLISPNTKKSNWVMYELATAVKKELTARDITILPRTLSGTNRRDAVLPNRNFGENNNWAILLRELNARMILFEFKNYDTTDIGHEEVIQTDNYLTEPMGKLAVMICGKLPDKGAHIQRNTIYSRHGKVILFLTKDHLKEMLFIKERGEDPSDLIVDLVERFYLQHE